VLEESDLTPAERALCAAAAAGRLLDCRARRPGEDNPAQGRSWGKDRQIRAQLLRQLLTGNGCLDQTFGPRWRYGCEECKLPAGSISAA
jgi:hypothetical protein